MARRTELGIAIAALIVAVLLAAVLYNPSPPVVILPNPNGYDDLVKAGQVLSGDPYTGGEAALRKIATDNSESLLRLRTGLNRDCRVPIAYSQAYVTEHRSILARMKWLAQTCVAVGKLAELEGRYGDAARVYLDTIRLGQESARGGVLIDRMVGTAIEAIGSAPLEALTSNLNSKECREIIQALGTIEKNQEPFEEVLQHEKEWSRRTFPWSERVVFRIQQLIKYRSVSPAEKVAFRNFQTIEQRRRTLVLDLAGRAFELERGQRPTNITELVPSYLKAIPLDPVTRTNMSLNP